MKFLGGMIKDQRHDLVDQVEYSLQRSQDPNTFFIVTWIQQVDDIASCQDIHYLLYKLMRP